MFDEHHKLFDAFKKKSGKPVIPQIVSEILVHTRYYSGDYDTEVKPWLVAKDPFAMELNSKILFEFHVEEGEISKKAFEQYFASPTMNWKKKNAQGQNLMM